MRSSELNKIFNKTRRTKDISLSVEQVEELIKDLEILEILKDYQILNVIGLDSDREKVERWLLNNEK